MIKSMTGFGRCEIASDDHKFTVEMRSVNHRYFDVNIRMPKKMLCFETAVRNLLKQKIERGKLDVFISYEDFSQTSTALAYHPAIAAEYMDCFRQMSEEFGIANDVTVSQLSRCPEVLTMEEAPVNEEELWKDLSQAVNGALDSFLEARIKEGAHLQKDLLEKLESIRGCVDFVEQYSPGLVETYRKKLTAKITEVLGDTTLDEARIATEVTIYADKICVDEETVRLKSHIDTMKETLQLDGPVGKKLDFIAQEMNREANTMLSKANDLELTNVAITLKTEIEKVREQIQNLE